MGMAETVLTVPELARVMARIVQDTKIGLMTRNQVVKHHGLDIARLAQELQGLKRSHPSLKNSVLTLLRLTPERAAGGIIPHLHECRTAAQAVFDLVSESMPEPAQAMLWGALADGSGLVKLPETAPRPSEVHRAYHGFSDGLRKALRQTRESGQGSVDHFRRYRGIELDQNPFLLRAVVVAWLETTAKELNPLLTTPPAKPSEAHMILLRQWAEALGWLVTTPDHFQNHCFDRKVKEFPFVRRASGTNFNDCLDLVNTHAKVELALVVDRSRGLTGHHPVALRATATKDTTLGQRFAEAIHDQRLRKFIVVASGCSEPVFLTAEKFCPGLARALTTLNPLNTAKGTPRADIPPAELENRLRAIAALLDLFLADPPVIDQKWFFGRNLVQAGMDTATQRRLIGLVNRRLKRSFVLHHHQNQRRLSHKLPDQVTTTGFEKFPVALANVLYMTVREVTQGMAGRKNIGAALETNGDLLRQVTCRWLDRTLKGMENILMSSEPSLPTEVKDERFQLKVTHVLFVMGWISKYPPQEQHGFFTSLSKQDWMQSRNFTYLAKMLMALNRLRETSYALETEKIAAKKVGSSPRSLYVVRRYVVDPGLRDRFNQKISNPVIRKMVQEASGLTTGLFFSESWLPEGLACAVVGLDPDKIPKITAAERHLRLEAVASIFDLFLTEPPLLEQRSFFQHRLGRQGLPPARQRALVATVNRELGTHYQIHHHDRVRLGIGRGISREVGREASPGLTLDAITLGMSLFVSGMGVATVTAIKGERIEVRYHATGHTSPIDAGQTTGGPRPLATADQVNGLLDRLRYTLEQVPDQEAYYRQATLATITEGLIDTLRQLHALQMTWRYRRTTTLTWVVPTYQRLLAQLVEELAFVSEETPEAIQQEMEKQLAKTGS